MLSGGITQENEEQEEERKVVVKHRMLVDILKKMANKNDKIKLVQKDMCKKVENTLKVR